MHRVHSFTLATALAVAFTGASAALAQSPRPQDPAQPSGRGQVNTTNKVSNEDNEFVQRAAAHGKMEVEHGKMAASKATNAQVKAFANQLVKDHTASNQHLMAIAKRKGIVLADQSMDRGGTPRTGGSSTTATGATKSGATRTEKSGTTGTTGASGGVATTGEARDRQADAGHRQGAGQMGHQMEPWMSATGAAFDRGFAEAQVKAHEEAIALFEKQANGGGDNDLKAFAQKQLPGLRNHLKRAQELQSKLSTTN